MKTIKNHINDLLLEEPFLLEAINDGLINVSALSRKIAPHISKLTGRKVNNNAIIMAIKRLELDDIFPYGKQLKKTIKALGDITVRSGLINYTFKNSKTLEFKISLLAQEVILFSQ